MIAGLTRVLPIVLATLACIATGAAFLSLPGRHHSRLLATYTTSLRGRSASQRHNATLAASRLDGAVIAPGEVFSFNRCVRVWSYDRGFVKAPVSFEGLLVEAVGGGVCQTSTTLYNAVLLAGLQIIERHPHAVAPTYVVPGRDAAVAQEALDLRFRNTTPRPLVIRTEASSTALTVRLYGRSAGPNRYVVVTRVLSREPPQLRFLNEPGAIRPRLSNRIAERFGTPGWHVVTYRCIMQDGREVYRERLSEDVYTRVDHAMGPTSQFQHDADLVRR